MKQVALANFGIGVKEDRHGLFRAILENHDVGWEQVAGNYFLHISEKTIFDGLYDKLCVVLDIPERMAHLFEYDITHLDVD